MKRYIVWVADNGARYIKANSVEETETEIRFIRIIKDLPVVCDVVLKKDMKEYHEILDWIKI